MRHAPPVPASDYFRPTVYVCDQDVADLPDGWAKRHAAELAQWAELDELSPTALAIAALHLPFRGLRTGKLGCGLQLTVAQWARLLGRSERMVQYGLEELRELGWLQRHRRSVRCEWTDSRGRRHRTADIVWVTYLTERATWNLKRRGETRRLKVLTGHGTRRVLTAFGLVGDLLAALTQKLRMLAKRCGSSDSHCTPSVESKLFREKALSRGTEVVGSASQTGLTRGTSPPSAVVDPRGRQVSLPWGSEGGGHARAARAVAEFLDDCWRRRAVTAATAQPEIWANASPARRAELVREFEPFRRALTRRVQSSRAGGFSRSDATKS